MMHLRYSSNCFHPNLNLFSTADCAFMNFLNFKVDLEYTEVEGCLKPFEIKDWIEYAEETRKLMAKEFRMELYHGNVKEKMEFGKKMSTVEFKF